MASKSESQWLGWRRKLYKGEPAPDYIIEAYGPGDYQFYCVHGSCRSLSEHEALKRKEHDDDRQLQRPDGSDQ